MGDRAGMGCIFNSCGTCDACKRGDEQHCANAAVQAYGPHRSGANNFGGSSNRIVVREAFVIRIPNGVDLADVAPLLCAGVTTFSPLKHWELEDAKSVAVVGLGGLGHVAVKIAAARGADVTVFTTTPSKCDAALAMGAQRVVVWPDDAAFASTRSSFEYVLSTTPYIRDFNPFLGVLRTEGIFRNLDLITPPATPINNALLMAGRRSIAGSITGSIAETQQAVDFCAARDINADVELIPIGAVNAAYDRVVKKDVRTRSYSIIRRCAKRLGAAAQSWPPW
ncbi:MAG: NAD(P)-dependent alcohol dehydrogenase [Caulobacterales bacterium]